MYLTTLADSIAVEKIINQALAPVPKDGLLYDLPIAISVIVLAGFLPRDKVENIIIVGELSFDCAVRYARGDLSMASTAPDSEFKQI